jgi:predicted lactoylglutathione lyase
MIAYITLGTNDIDRAGKFYDVLLGELGAGRVMESEQFICWATAPDQPMVAVTNPFDQKPATVGNGMMIALAAENPAAVDRLHAKALELGGTDEGAPGVRVDAFYIGYCRDLDGNKLNFCCAKDA